jgi:hypothetical protein
LQINILNIVCDVQPGVPLNLDELSQPYPYLIQQKEADRSSFKVLCDGQLCDCGETVVEAFDFLFKFLWVSSLEYPSTHQQFFSFFQFKVYKLQYGSKKPSPSVNEIARLLELK